MVLFFFTQSSAVISESVLLDYLHLITDGMGSTVAEKNEMDQGYISFCKCDLGMFCMLVFGLQSIPPISPDIHGFHHSKSYFYLLGLFPKSVKNRCIKGYLI